MDLPLGFGKTLDVGSWSYGLLGAFIQGGSSAISAGIGVSLLDPKDWNLGIGKFYALMGTVFLISGGLKAAAFLSGNPLPAVKQVEKSVQTTTEGSKPPKVVETVTEKHIEAMPTKGTGNGGTGTGDGKP